MAVGGASKTKTTTPEPAPALPAARMRLPLANIRIGRRLRPLNEARAQGLATTVGEQGLLNAILTRQIGFDDAGLPLVELVAGRHRLRAVEINGEPRIECVIRAMTDAEARLAEIDENLMGPDLSPLERATFVAARLEAWAARFPERVAADKAALAPKRGRPKNSEKISEFPVAMGFAVETAAEIGMTDKTVRNALAIARGLTPATHAAIAGTWIGKAEGVLRQLAGVTDPAEQAAVVEQLLGGRTRSVSDARAHAAGRTPAAAVQTPVDETLKALSKLWKGAPKTHREAMLHWLQGQTLPAGWAITDGGEG